MNSMQRGFTLIELLVVIAIIGLLGSVVLASLATARAKGYDARRKSDLNQIRTALHLYYNTHNNYVEVGSGCGWSGNGNGWFNYSGGSYPRSIGQCLVDAGALGTEIKDPTGSVWSNPTTNYAYMKYSCGNRTFIYAKLESEPQSTTATDGTCCSACDSSYGMNYYLEI